MDPCRDWAISLRVKGKGRLVRQWQMVKGLCQVWWRVVRGLQQVKQWRVVMGVGCVLQGCLCPVSQQGT